MTAHEIIHEVLFITARKRSLGQGNRSIFTSVCRSVHGGDMHGIYAPSRGARTPPPPPPGLILRNAVNKRNAFLLQLWTQTGKLQNRGKVFEKSRNE